MPLPPLDFLPARRRVLLAGALALLLEPVAASAGDAAAAASLLAEGERALRAGRPAEAATWFERASRIDDTTATAELGMLRAALQAGDYLHAVAWSRLVAGEHTGSAEAAAWADAVESLARPNAARATRVGVAPLPGPAAARPAGSGMRLGCGLIDGAGGRLHALPRVMDLIARGERPWVIDGTGNAWRVHDAQGSLRREAPTDAEPPPASRVRSLRGALARPGQPVLVLHAPVTPHDEADWPRLAPALLTYPAAGERLPGVALAGPRPADGSPVFDACGAWLGWWSDGRLESPRYATADAGCTAGPAADVAAVYDRWYAAVGVIRRAE